MLLRGLVLCRGSGLFCSVTMPGTLAGMGLVWRGCTDGSSTPGSALALLLLWLPFSFCSQPQARPCPLGARTAPECPGLICCSLRLLVCLHTNLSYLSWTQKGYHFSLKTWWLSICRIYPQQPGALSPTVSTVCTPLLCLDLCALSFAFCSWNVYCSSHYTFSLLPIYLLMVRCSSWILQLESGPLVFSLLLCSLSTSCCDLFHLCPLPSCAFWALGIPHVAHSGAELSRSEGRLESQMQKCEWILPLRIVLHLYLKWSASGSCL